MVDSSVWEQWLWCFMASVSGMIGLGYGPFPPRTWGEALVWSVGMIVVASMFAVINGFIVATILTGARGRSRQKEHMDLVLVRMSGLSSGFALCSGHGQCLEGHDCGCCVQHDWGLQCGQTMMFLWGGQKQHMGLMLMCGPQAASSPTSLA